MFESIDIDIGLTISNSDILTSDNHWFRECSIIFVDINSQRGEQKTQLDNKTFHAVQFKDADACLSYQSGKNDSACKTRSGWLTKRSVSWFSIKRTVQHVWGGYNLSICSYIFPLQFIRMYFLKEQRCKIRKITINQIMYVYGSIVLIYKMNQFTVCLIKTTLDIWLYCQHNHHQIRVRPQRHQWALKTIRTLIGKERTYIMGGIREKKMILRSSQQQSKISQEPID